MSKNGELVQTIRITSHENFDDNRLRKQIREAISKTIDPQNFAYWIHTFRDKLEGQDLPKKADPALATNINQFVDSNWNRDIPQELEYSNKIYITIIHAGQKYRLKSMKNIMRAFFYKSLTNYCDDYLESSKQKLSAAVSSIMADLQGFDPHLLTLRQDENGQVFTEPTEFLHLLLTLRSEPIALRQQDLSTTIFDEEAEFNPYLGIIKLQHLNGETTYASMISFKESVRIPSSALTNLLNMKHEFVITQIIEFSQDKKAIERKKKQRYAAQLGQDELIDKYLKEENDIYNHRFGMEQTTIMMVEETQQDLERAVYRMNNELSKHGLTFIHEDIKMEHAFWAQLPGNFSFIQRQNLVPEMEFCHFATLGSNAMGRKNTKWGEFITYFYDKDNFIYYYNFHTEENGNTLIVSDIEEDRNIMTHFLLTMGQKLQPIVFYVDLIGAGHLVSTMLGGQTIGVDEQVLDSNFIHFDLSSRANIEGKVPTSLVTQLLDRIMDTCHGDTREIIVINSLECVDDNLSMVAYLNEWLDRLQAKNAFSIICSKHDVRPSASIQEEVEVLLNKCSTHFFSSDHESSITLGENYSLTDLEIRRIEQMDDDFWYLKQGEYEIEVKFDLPHVKQVETLLNGENAAGLADIYMQNGQDFKTLVTNVG